MKKIISTGGDDGSNDKAIEAGNETDKQEEYMESSGMVQTEETETSVFLENEHATASSVQMLTMQLSASQTIRLQFIVKHY
jgi:hypothetical protein